MKLYIFTSLSDDIKYSVVALTKRDAEIFVTDFIYKEDIRNRNRVKDEYNAHYKNSSDGLINEFLQRNNIKSLNDYLKFYGVKVRSLNEVAKFVRKNFVVSSLEEGEVVKVSF